MDKSGRQIVKNRRANWHNQRIAQLNNESVPVSEAARLAGLSARTVKRMCDSGQLASFRSPGGHVRVVKADLERFLRHASTPAPASSVLQNKRERIEELGLEAQQLRAKRDLEELREEAAEAERRRTAAVESGQLAQQRALEETSLRREREADQRKQEQQRAQRAHSWLEAALKSLPQGLPPEIVLDVREQVEQVLSKLTPAHCDSVVKLQVEAARDKALMPWIQQSDTEWAIQQGRWQLLGAPDEWQARYDIAAREEIGFVSAASRAHKRAVAVQTADQVASEYKAEQARARVEQEHQRRESMKGFLVSLGVEAVGPYLKKLHLEDEIFDEDLERKTELKQAVRKALEDRLTGAEGVEETQRIVREIVDAELS